MLGILTCGGQRLRYDSRSLHITTEPTPGQGTGEHIIRSGLAREIAKAVEETRLEDDIDDDNSRIERVFKTFVGESVPPNEHTISDMLPQTNVAPEARIHPTQEP